jgi:WD40 repeat protein/tRNA A-37 threonylcarbamoyl transferase component Bud32
MGGELDGSALIGRALGEFVIRKPLSGGGFGMVFLADQKALRREAVVKVLRESLREDESTVQRFLREARLASLLDHPYAAHTYGFGAEPDGLLWIAMEHVRGTPLDALLRVQGPIPLERFVPLLRRICEVVATAHEQGIVHRDLKPANVMVLSRAGQLLPKLLDFGIAKLTGAAEAPTLPPTAAPLAADDSGEADLQLTLGRVAMGSPHYMAPEQWSDAGAADARADIYSLGVICYQSLTGRLPFRAPSREGLASMHAVAPVPPLGDGLPAALDQVLARAMAKRPAQRHASALDLAADFEEASGTRAVTVALPRLDPSLRSTALTRAPQPLARAIAALEAARNPHEARDGIWQIARVAVRLVAGIALAAHRHVAIQAHANDPAVGEQLRRLRQRAPADAVWLDVARALVRPFADLRDAHPVPELVDYLLGDGCRPLAELLALHIAAEERSGGGEKQVRELLERALPIAARAVEALAFLFDYPLVVATDRAEADAATVDFRPRTRRGEGSGEVWMGMPGPARPRLALAGDELPTGRAALVDSAGIPVVTLWPFVQLCEPSPGAEPMLFFFDGHGRRGARLIAAPDPFEVEDDAGWQAFGDLLDESSDGEGSIGDDELSPYPGLRAFTEADAGSFVGRERETEAVVNRLRVQPLLVVAGPSGAGKSSFVQAGVLPALPPTWSSIVVRPGPAPIAALSARLAAAGIDAGDLCADPDALGTALRARGAGTTVLVVDQLEELFTVCDDAAERALYAAALARAARSPDDPVRVVMTVRDDFLARAEAMPAWHARLALGLHILTTPAEPELRRILLEPLRRAGYEMDDPALADEMVATVAGAAGALALLSFTAGRLWELRDRRFRQLTRGAYRSLGGVAGALAQHAEETLAAMSADEQRLVREVFRHAVTAEGTRAILSPDELEEALGGGPQATSVVGKLVAARLLVVSDVELGERIEVAHETLLEAWPRLVTWRREEAEGARLRDLLRTAARQWQERGRPHGLLWRDEAVTEYRIWRGRHPAPLTASEEAFAAASLAEAARSRRRIRALVGGVFLALIAVAIALLILRARAETQRALAVESKHAAERSAKDLHDNLVEQYEAQGRRLVLADDPLHGLAYLARAAELGARGVPHDFLIAQAVRATDGELLSVHHDHFIVQVRFSLDDALLFTTGVDNQARVWDAKTGALVASLPHGAPVIRLALSPDGRVLATGSVDGAVKLWRPDGTALRELTTRGSVQAIDFSPDGRQLVTATSTEQVLLWDAGSGALVRQLAAPASDGLPFGDHAAFSPDGTLVAAGSRAGPVQIWSADDGRPVASLDAHIGSVRIVRFSPDRRRLLSGGKDGMVHIWEVGRWKRVSSLRHRDDIRWAAWSPDGQRVLTASADATAGVWDAATGERLLTLDGHQAAVNMAAWSPDGRTVATVSDDMTAQLWDAATGARLARRLGHTAAIVHVAFGGDGTRVATAGADRSAVVWSTEPTHEVRTLIGHRGGIFRVDISADSRRIATAGADGTARVWDAASGQELRTFEAHRPIATDVRFGPDGDRLATAGTDGVVRIWSLATGQRIAELRGHSKQIQAIAWYPDGDRIASAGDDGTLRVWSTRSGQEVLELRAHRGKTVFGVAVDPTGSRLASAGDDASTALWDATSGRELDRIEGRGMYSSVFAADGERLLSYSSGSAVIWRRRDGSVVAELVGHLGPVTDARWNHDSTLVVTASQDKAARIWDPESGDLLAVYPHAAKIQTARLAPDGRYLVTGSQDGTATIWRLPAWKGDLDRLMRCRVPYRIERDQMVTGPRDVSSCSPTPPHR